jgi:hypothetical protein
MEWTDYLVLQQDSHSISANTETGSTQTTSSMQHTVSLSGAAEEKIRLLTSLDRVRGGAQKRSCFNPGCGLGCISKS